ncbi:MAG: DUF2007 domain-containing protein [Thermoanaerobaculia bacterium]|nr:DUF2007 domain-containing protein [Thermoanaerobaculia bacterium]
MGDEWPIVEVVGTDVEASIIEGFLESQGIECQIESLRFHQEPVNFGGLGEVRVRVPADDLEAAREALRELRAAPPPLDEGDAGEDVG